MDKIKIDLGIDIGTSFSSVAYTNIKDNISFVEPLSLIGINGLLPSAVLTDANNKMIAFGQNAIELYKTGKGSNLIREFKMALGETDAIEGSRIHPRDVYKAFLLHIRQVIEKTYSLNLNDSRICVTYPANKNRTVKIDEIFRIAEDVFKGCDVFGLDEAAAITQFIDSRKGFLTSKPLNILIIDSGGGTTDFALAEAKYPILQKEPLTILETESIGQGGRDIDSAIFTATLALKGRKMPRRDAQHALDLIREAKEIYDWKSGAKFEVKELGIEMTNNRLIACVNPVILKIIETAKTMESNAIQRGLKIEKIILAGGNSRIAPLLDSLNSNFPLISREHVPVNNIQTAVAEGATYFIQGENETIKYKLAYDVIVKYTFNNSRLSKKIAKRQDKIPTSKPSGKEILVKAQSFTELNVDLSFIKNQGSRTEDSLRIVFDPPLSDLDDLKITFEIDANGYLRYTVEPLRFKNKIYRGVHKKVLFDK